MVIIIGKIKGYRICDVTSKSFEVKKYSFDELKNKNSKIEDEIKKILNDGGKVFGLTKDKTLKLVYLFKKVDKDEQRTLEIQKKVVLDECLNCIDEFEENLELILEGELMCNKSIDKAIWNNKEFLRGSNNKFFPIMWISIGIVFSILFNSYIWLFIYTLIGLSSISSIKKVDLKTMKEIDKKQDKESKATSKGNTFYKNASISYMLINSFFYTIIETVLFLYCLTTLGPVFYEFSTEFAKNDVTFLELLRMSILLSLPFLIFNLLLHFGTYVIMSGKKRN